jgi:hypothetical protein
LIIRDIKPGIEFFTAPEDWIQIGGMKRPAGYVVRPHWHLRSTKEVLFVKSGSVCVSGYTRLGGCYSSHYLFAGEMATLPQGHGLVFVEDSELFEVKQGPYVEDKVYFE